MSRQTFTQRPGLRMYRDIQAPRTIEAWRKDTVPMRRRSDARNEFDAWRGPAWGYVAYAAMLLGSLFMLTPWGKALLLFVWGVK